jgi:predicted GNAT superfamily acetyltransferase
MHWTFDPLQSRNAYVNFKKLGIISREYVRDMYGNTGSPLHEAVGTDRLIATWEMDSQRVAQRLEGRDDSPAAGAGPGLPRALEGERGDRGPEPGTPRLGLTDEAVLVAIPRDVDRIMAHDPALALRWREATRSAFQDYLGRGYEVRELLTEEGLSHYLLQRSDIRREGPESTWEGGHEGT